MTAGRVGPSSAAGWVEADGVVYAAVLPDGPPLVLGDSGALVWRAVVAGGTEDEVVERVASAAGTSADVVAGDVLGFLHDLVTAGLVTRA